MTQRWFDWAMEQETITVENRVTLFVLAYHAADDGRGSLPMVDLMDMTRIKPEQQQRSVLHNLESYGLVFASVGQAGMVSYRLRKHRAAP